MGKGKKYREGKGRERREREVKAGKGRERREREVKARKGRELTAWSGEGVGRAAAATVAFLVASHSSSPRRPHQSNESICPSQTGAATPARNTLFVFYPFYPVSRLHKPNLRQRKESRLWCNLF